MSPDPGERFEREYGCTEGEWIAWMPGATQGRPCSSPGPRRLRVELGGGALELRWEPLPPRVIALIRLPRLAVWFEFTGVDAAERRAFQRRFDLQLQRGGG